MTSPAANVTPTSTDAAPQGSTLELVESQFSLVVEINRLIDDGGLADPREIATAVRPLIPVSEVERVLAALLIYAVRQTIHARRSRNVAKQAGQSNDSPKWRDAADQLRRRLNTPVWTGTEHKAHGACTAQDLLCAVEHHRAVVEQNRSVAAKYEAQAAAMRKHKVQRFGDLPPSTLEVLL